MENASDWVPPRADTKHNEELDTGDLAESRSAYLSQGQDRRYTDRQEGREGGPYVTISSLEDVMPDWYLFLAPFLIFVSSKYYLCKTENQVNTSTYKGYMLIFPSSKKALTVAKVYTS